MLVAGYPLADSWQPRRVHASIVRNLFFAWQLFLSAILFLWSCQYYTKMTKVSAFWEQPVWKPSGSYRSITKGNSTNGGDSFIKQLTECPFQTRSLMESWQSRQFVSCRHCSARRHRVDLVCRCIPTPPLTLLDSRFPCNKNSQFWHSLVSLSVCPLCVLWSNSGQMIMTDGRQTVAVTENDKERRRMPSGRKLITNRGDKCNSSSPMAPMEWRYLMNIESSSLEMPPFRVSPPFPFVGTLATLAINGCKCRKLEYGSTFKAS